MNIQEATRKALAEKKLMTREGEAFLKCRLEPTDGWDCCSLHSWRGVVNPRWAPKAEDLLADDWIVVP